MLAGKSNLGTAAYSLHNGNWRRQWGSERSPQTAERAALKEHKGASQLGEQWELNELNPPKQQVGWWQAPPLWKPFVAQRRIKAF